MLSIAPGCGGSLSSAVIDRARNQACLLRMTSNQPGSDEHRSRVATQQLSTGRLIRRDMSSNQPGDPAGTWRVANAVGGNGDAAGGWVAVLVIVALVPLWLVGTLRQTWTLDALQIVAR